MAHFLKMGPEDLYREAAVPVLNANKEKTLIRKHKMFSIKIFKRHEAFQRIMQIYHAVCHLAHFIISHISVI